MSIDIQVDGLKLKGKYSTLTYEKFGVSTFLGKFSILTTSGKLPTIFRHVSGNVCLHITLYFVTLYNTSIRIYVSIWLFWVDSLAWKLSGEHKSHLHRMST